MAVVALTRFGCAVQGRTVLSAIDLELHAGRALGLIGPAGSGKSLLLRLVANAGAELPAVTHWGSLEVGVPTAFVPQRVRPRAATPADEATRTHLARVRAALEGDAQLICLDEPTAGLDGFSRAQLLQSIRHLRGDRSVLYVTHNRRDALALGGDVALLADRRLIESGEATSFFAAPTTELGRCYVRTGSCPTSFALATAEPVPEVADADTTPASPSPSGATARGHRELAWIIPGALAGCSRPGLVGDLDDDLASLQAAGIQHLVCLEETDPIEPRLKAQYGIHGHRLAIADMDVPTRAEMIALCRFIDGALAMAEPVAIHCRGGLGRTGTALAAYLQWAQQLSPAEALTTIRRVEPGFVQSIAQLDFLEAFQPAGPRPLHTTTA